MKVFCDSGCRSSWRADRRAGLIRPAIRLAEGVLVSWDDASIAAGRCPYCGRMVVEWDSPARAQFRARVLSDAEAVAR